MHQIAWHPAACAAALKSIEIIEREHILQNVLALEALAKERLEPLVARYQIVGDVRIKGLYIALEFVLDKTSKSPAPDLTRQIHTTCIQHGLVPVHEAGLWWIRLYPALNMLADTFSKGCDFLEESIRAVSLNHGLGIDA
jgi:4-aminobutyrate aminotransferase-like enzyme